MAIKVNKKEFYSYYPYSATVPLSKWEESVGWLTEHYGTPGSRYGSTDIWYGEWAFVSLNSVGGVGFKFKQEQVCVHFVLMWG